LASSQSSVSRHPWTFVFVLLVLALGGYFGWNHFHGDAAKTATSAAAKTDHGAAAVPVTVALAQIADFPVYLNGLGTVQPYNTVTVRSRVDGEIVKIAFKQGQMVKEGDILAQIDPRPYQATLDQALAKRAQDEASLKDAQLNLKRYGSLAQKEFASRQQLDTQEAAVDVLAAQIKGDQAAIDNAQTQLDYTTIRSPIAGKTGFRVADAGNIVHGTDTTGIVTIVQLQPISVVFTAPEESVSRINAALASGDVAVDALSSDGLKTLARGHLALVNNQIDQESGTIRMKATFENADNALWPGLSVSTRLLVETLKQVTVVPQDAVQRGPNGLYAFVVGPDNKVDMRGIAVTDEGNALSVISKGLSPGQNVVIAGQYRLQPGVLVQPSEVAAPGAPASEADAQSTTAKVP
jgi:multidrug efflux system membrane fusion protein